MQYICHYDSPLGPILLAADDIGLTGLWFEAQAHYARGLDSCCLQAETAVLAEGKRWLEIYFTGREPDFTPAVHFTGTPFQNEVLEILRTIPYGKTVTYGDIGKILAHRRGLARFSAQAVGGAVGRNPISLIVPCHRVVGTDGALTGYAGGLARKAALLSLEGWKISPSLRLRP